MRETVAYWKAKALKHQKAIEDAVGVLEGQLANWGWAAFEHGSAEAMRDLRKYYEEHIKDAKEEDRC